MAVIASSFANRIVRIDDDGQPTVTAEVPDLILPNDIIWTGADFVALSSAGPTALRIDASGQPLQRFPVGDPSASVPTLVAGAPRLTIAYDKPVRIAPGAGTIRRAFFDFVSEHRRRAR